MCGFQFEKKNSHFERNPRGAIGARVTDRFLFLCLAMLWKCLNLSLIWNCSHCITIQLPIGQESFSACRMRSEETGRVEMLMTIAFCWEANDKLEFRIRVPWRKEKKTLGLVRLFSRTCLCIAEQFFFLMTTDWVNGCKKRNFNSGGVSLQPRIVLAMRWWRYRCYV